MKKIILMILIFSQIALAQFAPSKYEAEILKNPNKGGKDTRQVNAVLIFEKDSLKIVSRRRNETFKEFRYSDIKYVEHSYSKNPFLSQATKMTIAAILVGLPIYGDENEKHWLTVVASDDFAVLKIENDNFRLIKSEFLIRNFDLVNIDENK